MENKYNNIHQKLINECRKGNTKAQFEIYKLYYKAMFNTSLRLLNNKHEAEDIMQEAFLSAFNKIDTYKEEVSFGAWLKKIVINRSLDELKKRRIFTEEINDINCNIIDNDIYTIEPKENSQMIEQIKKAVDSLPVNYRTLITLHLFEGYDHDEISEITGMSNAAVRTGYSRARKRLQSLLNEKKSNVWTN